MMRHLICSLLCLSLISGTAAKAQDSLRYHRNWKVDLGITAGSLAVAGAGAYCYLGLKRPLSTDELVALDPASINPLDRSATLRYSPGALTASHILAYGSMALPFTLLAIREVRIEWLYMGFMYAEVGLITFGVTEITKAASGRIRPLAYNPAFDMETRMEAESRKSFFSGHTANAAAFCFLTARIFADHSDSKVAKALVWTGAATIPAVTGFLRYWGGKHFPTDIITGYIVGGAIGYFVPYLHRKRWKDDRLSVLPFGGLGSQAGLCVLYRL
jgi:membrane-associated phospholipid phosphatase